MLYVIYVIYIEHASKRQSLRTKYKIVRKVREYKRKLKRKGLRDPNAPRSNNISDNTYKYCCSNILLSTQTERVTLFHRP